jgi:hypothetical protein
MSRQPPPHQTHHTYEQPSCMKENLLSIWIWMREHMDIEIQNRTTAMIAENNLVSVRDNIEKNKEKILVEQESAMNELRTKARLCKGGTKEQRVVKLKKLLPLMQRFKKYRHQTQLASQQLTLLDVQINAFENGRFQKEMTDTLRAGVVAMRKVGISDDASAMDTIVLDMEQTMSDQRELTDSMSLSLVNSMDDNNSDEGLMRELMLLAGDDDDPEDNEEVPSKTTSNIYDVPTIPMVALPPTPVSVTDQVSPTYESTAVPDASIAYVPENSDTYEIESMQNVELLT